MIGPPNTLNSCQAVIRNRMAQKQYCMTVKAFDTRRKYSCMAVMSAPSEFSMIRVMTIRLSQLAAPSTERWLL